MGWGFIIQKILGWEKVKEILINSDTDTVTFTGLNAAVDTFYMLLATVKNPTASDSQYRIYVENDTDPSNYYHEYIASTGSSVSASTANNPNLLNVAAGDRSFTYTFITLDPDGYFRYFSNCNEQTGSNQTIVFRAGSRVTSVTNITRIDIISTVSSAIGAGSKFVLLRCKSG